MTDQLLEAFVLGNASIVTTVGVLPSYPSMVAYLAADTGRLRRWSGVLGVLVPAGVLTMMLAVGLSRYLLHRTFGSILPWLLPLVYGSVIVPGVGLLLAAPVQRRFTHALTDRYGLPSPSNRASVHGLRLLTR
jgi:cytochrome c-type biogenesis protein